jgi:signal transduction histidine kinase
MYLSLAQEIVNEPILRDHLDKIEKITELIQKQIRFTRDYQNIGTNAPMWQNVQLSIDNAISDLHLGSVALDVDVDNLEIYADMLLEKVFYNLVENTLRHGEKVTKIKFYFEHNDSGGILICEDNGIGIPPNVKEKIFKREYYRNTGYGLFLVTEILSITGLSIKETGEFNHGARFKISIPLEFFRFTN